MERLSFSSPQTTGPINGSWNWAKSLSLGYASDPELRAEMAERRHILIADDHPLMRSALAQAVARALPDVELLEAASLDQVFSVLHDRLLDNAIDLVLLDLHMPGMSGFTGLHSIRAEFPAIPVVVISASEDPVTVSRALD